MKKNNKQTKLFFYLKHKKRPIKITVDDPYIRIVDFLEKSFNNNDNFIHMGQLFFNKKDISYFIIK